MKLPFHIVELLKRKSGNGLRLPSDCELLSLDIESKTKVRIGATTLKRLLGFAHDERTPHAATLDAIAHYLGYAHWDELLAIEDTGNSDFEAPKGELRSADLHAGSSVEITYSQTADWYSDIWVVAIITLWRARTASCKQAMRWRC